MCPRRVSQELGLVLALGQPRRAARRRHPRRLGVELPGRAQRRRALLGDRGVDVAAQLVEERARLRGHG